MSRRFSKTVKDKPEWRSVELPANLVADVEELMKNKHERRPMAVPLGLFIGDLIRESLEKVRAHDMYPSMLESYAIESDCIYIRDNPRDVVAELRFKDQTDLYCDIDGAKNCVHIGFAWAIPEVQKLISDRKLMSKKAKKEVKGERN